MYAREQINDEGSLANRLINYVYVDPNCTLMAFTSTGRFLRFNSEEEFEAFYIWKILQDCQNVYMLQSSKSGEMPGSKFPYILYIYISYIFFQVLITI